MLIPIGHEEDTVRRLPWITFGIMIVCTVMLLGVAAFQPDMSQAYDSIEDAVNYWMEHPYLELDPRIEGIVWGEVTDEERDEFRNMWADTVPPPGGPEQRRAEQEELDRLCEKALEGASADPYRKFGLIPANQTFLGWLAHMFMHGDLLHLLGNMLILYLLGPFIEDKWGRAVYSGFYLSAGVFASLVFVVLNLDSDIPLVGASGAIAGVMGAFLVRYWHTKIKFFYWFGWFWRGTFDAPAWLMLPLWFFEQVIFGMISDSMGGGGVAYWAHVGGFAFGSAVALLFKQNGIEERYLRPALDAKLENAVIRNTAVELALVAQEEGNPERAFEILSEAVRSDPADQDAALAMWTLCEELHQPELAVPALAGLIREELRTGDSELAVRHWNELNHKVPGHRLEPDLAVRLARAQCRHGDAAGAAETFRMAMLTAGSDMKPGTALQIASGARQIDPRLSKVAAELALAHPELMPMERARVMEILDGVNQQNVNSLIS